MTEYNIKELKSGGLMKQKEKDLFSFRLRIVGGFVDAKQLIKLSEIASKYGKGYIHLTSVIVLMWLYSDNPDNFSLLENYTKGALWGIVPSILFFIIAYSCFRKHLPISVVLSASFGVWLIGAFIHQWFL